MKPKTYKAMATSKEKKIATVKPAKKGQAHPKNTPIKRK